MYILDDYYQSGAWNIKKAHAESHAQMKKNIYQLLQNIDTRLINIQRK